MALKREYGGIQPCIRLGIFRIRIPFIHFNISGPEIITGLMNACTSYGALAVLISTLGLDPNTAYALVIFETACYKLVLRRTGSLRLDYGGDGSHCALSGNPSRRRNKIPSTYCYTVRARNSIHSIRRYRVVQENQHDFTSSLERWHRFRCRYQFCCCPYV